MRYNRFAAAEDKAPQECDLSAVGGGHTARGIWHGCRCRFLLRGAGGPQSDKLIGRRSSAPAALKAINSFDQGEGCGCFRRVRPKAPGEDSYSVQLSIHADPHLWENAYDSYPVRAAHLQRGPKPLAQDAATTIGSSGWPNPG